jgi:adenylylsulfate kinase
MINLERFSPAPATVARAGRTYWVTGLPGAGKTTIGRRLWQRLQADGRFAIFLDGDVLRGILGGEHGHSQQARRALAQSYAQLCRELTLQGADVVCATVSMFESVRQWNRANLPDYREIYLRVPFAILRHRNPKGLYAAALAGQADDVPGVNQSFEEPRSPHEVVDNDGSSSPDDIAGRLYSRLCTR